MTFMLAVHILEAHVFALAHHLNGHFRSRFGDARMHVVCHVHNILRFAWAARQGSTTGHGVPAVRMVCTGFVRIPRG